MHRPVAKVLPSEKVEKNAQTGPRPTFQYTWLQRAAALWPEEPEPPVTHVPYDAPDGTAPETRAVLVDLLAVRGAAAEPEPSVDVRR